ncbi:MAG: hypothetical protein ACHRHE_08020 [Tepidisphaerales bacterium]
MPTTVELTPEELASVKAFTHQADDAAAVRCATIEYLRYIRRMQLKASAGKFPMDADWRAHDAAELRSRHGD